MGYWERLQRVKFLQGFRAQILLIKKMSINVAAIKVSFHDDDRVSERVSKAIMRFFHAPLLTLILRIFEEIFQLKPNSSIKFKN